MSGNIHESVFSISVNKETQDVRAGVPSHNRQHLCWAVIVRCALSGGYTGASNIPCLKKFMKLWKLKSCCIWAAGVNMANNILHARQKPHNPVGGTEAGCERGAAVQWGVISEEVRSLIAWPSLGRGWETGQTSGDECIFVRCQSGRSSPCPHLAPSTGSWLWSGQITDLSKCYILPTPRLA